MVYFSLFDWTLAFVDTNVAGGDMISHPVISTSLRNQILSGNFWSWNHGWFAGFPFLYFYFYPIYIIAVFLQTIGFSEAVSFKVMVLTVVGMVPTVYYVSARRWLSIPFATLTCALGTAIFLNEFDSRWGGNFKSLLAGQVSHQFGLVMMVAFFSYLVKGGPNKPGAIITFALAILGHVYSALFAALLLAVYYVAKSIELKSVKKIIPDFRGPLISLGLTAFFWIPFLAYRNATVAPINNTEVAMSEMLRVVQFYHPLYSMMYIGSLVFLVVAAIKKKNIWLPLGVFLLALLSALSMPFLKGTPLLHIRLPAEIYLMAMMTFVLALRQAELPIPFEWSGGGLLALLVLQSFVPSPQLDQVLPRQVRWGLVDIPHWWKWNMSGIQDKANAQDVTGIWEYLKNIPDREGRIAVEYGDYNAYGSPRIFELTPNMTGKPIMEGLLLESSPMYPAYYYISFFFNQQTWWPGFPVTVPPRNPELGLRYFGLYNVRYFVAAQETTKADLKAKGHKLLYGNAKFEIYDVNPESRIANVIEGGVPAIESKTPLMQTVLNFPESLDRFVEVKPGKVFPEEAIRKTDVSLQKLIPLNGQWSKDGQEFTVEDTTASDSAPKDLLFKISYFPNWRTSSGDPVRIVTPNLMMVTTKAKTLKLYYRPGNAERVAAFISIAALLFWISFGVRGLRKREVAVG